MKASLRLLFLAASLLAIPIQGMCAVFYSGRDLMQWVMEAEKMVSGEKYVAADVFQFTGYMVGIADMSSIRGSVCLPKEIKVGNLAQAVSSYVKANPDEVRFDAADLVQWALVAAYPCKGSGSALRKNYQ